MMSHFRRLMGVVSMRVSMTVNGSTQDNDVEPRLLLVFYLREVLGLTGTKIGCDTTSCGACTVLRDGESVEGCTEVAVLADGGRIHTNEVISGPDGCDSYM